MDGRFSLDALLIRSVEDSTDCKLFELGRANSKAIFLWVHCGRLNQLERTTDMLDKVIHRMPEVCLLVVAKFARDAVLGVTLLRLRAFNENHFGVRV